jgi:hypothetical protein
MALKIKWNDDRVRGTAVAVLLISRTRLLEGRTDDLIRSALQEYRADPQGYKAAYPNRDLAAAKDSGGLKAAGHADYYRALVAHTERLLATFEKNRRQFNSLAELDNFLSFTLPSFD